MRKTRSPRKCKTDLRCIYEYIAFSLSEPETAAGQVRAIMNAIRSPDEMPMRFRQYENEPWFSQGVRILPVSRYVIFYLPQEDRRAVSTMRIMYGCRDLAKQL
ncbi:MAG: type II toxin-antitoxin system RelE/ParE family toxin, partial [Oscillospiraceae bacterium]|nr:type II toxin-antitoxin system RelE/ParE family toxin [Oscillospiraceae bacterium]